jgi:hypothetical protein
MPISMRQASAQKNRAHTTHAGRHKSRRLPGCSALSSPPLPALLQCLPPSPLPVSLLNSRPPPKRSSPPPPPCSPSRSAPILGSVPLVRLVQLISLSSVTHATPSAILDPHRSRRRNFCRPSNYHRRRRFSLLRPLSKRMQRRTTKGCQRKFLASSYVVRGHFQDLPFVVLTLPSDLVISDVRISSVYNIKQLTLDQSAKRT